jgi:ABC-2 type transport system permease protein
VTVSLYRVGRLARKELRQMLRDLRMRGVIFVAPLIQLVVFGYAVSTDVRNVPIFVVDRDGSAESRALVDRITASGYFRVAGRSNDGDALIDALERGRALVGIEIPPWFGADLVAGRGAAVQALIDGTDSNTGTVALGYLQGLVRGIQEDRGPRPGGGVVLAARAWYNPSLESRVYNVPAVVGALLLVITMLLTSLSVVREREVGTWEQLVVSPVSPTELMLGKTLPVALIGLVDLVVVSTVAVLWFDIPLRGSPLILLLGAVAFILAGLALGLLISTVSATQQEAFMSMFLILLPALIFSGFMFPISSMPKAFQVATLLNPLRHFLEVVRAVFLKGAGLGELWPQYLALYGMAGGGLALAVWRFRRTI